MSDFLKHECGIAMIRLLKPLSYFQEKYDTPLYGFNQLFLLMESSITAGKTVLELAASSFVWHQVHLHGARAHYQGQLAFAYF